MSIKPLPAVHFSVLQKDDIYQIAERRIKVEANANKLTTKVAHVAWNIFSTLIFPIGIYRYVNFLAKQIIPLLILPATKKFDKKNIDWSEPDDILLQLHAGRDAFFANPANNTEQVTIRTADKVDLDSAAIHHPYQQNLPANEQKWIICFHGNAGCYEYWLSDFKALSDQTGASILSGNYRSVMRSKAHPAPAFAPKANEQKPKPLTPQDLFLDGEAMVQYLLDKGVQPKNILLNGWSLGGAVATAVAAQHQEPGQELNLCVNRSFSSTTEVAKSWFPFPIGWLFAKMIVAAGWNIDNVANYQKVKGNKFIVTGKKDRVIQYPASLYKGLKEKQMTLDDRKRKKLRAQKGVVQAKYPQLYKPKNMKLSVGHCESIESIQEFRDLAKAALRIPDQVVVMGPIKEPSFIEQCMQSMSIWMKSAA